MLVLWGTIELNVGVRTFTVPSMPLANKLTFLDRSSSPVYLVSHLSSRILLRSRNSHHMVCPMVREGRLELTTQSHFRNTRSTLRTTPNRLLYIDQTRKRTYYLLRVIS